MGAAQEELSYQVVQTAMWTSPIILMDADSRFTFIQLSPLSHTLQECSAISDIGVSLSLLQTVFIIAYL
jgi:hypothetical protein